MITIIISVALTALGAFLFLLKYTKSLKEELKKIQEEEYLKGREEGYKAGYRKGYQVGYQDGYQEGLKEGEKKINTQLAVDLFRKEKEGLIKAYNQAKKALEKKNREFKKLNDLFKQQKELYHSKLIIQIIKAPKGIVISALRQRKDVEEIADALPRLIHLGNN